jgi:hypothetical protein
MTDGGHDGNHPAHRCALAHAIMIRCLLLSFEAQPVRGDQPRRRSAIDTSAASAAWGTVKPALTRPLEVSTSLSRRQLGADVQRPRIE